MSISHGCGGHDAKWCRGLLSGLTHSRLFAIDTMILTAAGDVMYLAIIF